VDTIILSCPRSRLLLGPTGPLTWGGDDDDDDGDGDRWDEVSPSAPRFHPSRRVLD
jgi:hypothetical protein